MVSSSIRQGGVKVNVVGGDVQIPTPLEVADMVAETLNEIMVRVVARGILLEPTGQFPIEPRDARTQVGFVEILRNLIVFVALEQIIEISLQGRIKTRVPIFVQRVTLDQSGNPFFQMEQAFAETIESEDRDRPGFMDVAQLGIDQALLEQVGIDDKFKRIELLKGFLDKESAAGGIDENQAGPGVVAVARAIDVDFKRRAGQGVIGTGHQVGERTVGQQGAQVGVGEKKGQPDKSNLGEIDTGVCGVELPVVAAFERVRPGGGVEEAGHFVFFGHKDVIEVILPAAHELHRRAEQKRHGFASAGQGGMDRESGLRAHLGDLGQDPVGEGLVIAIGADVAEGFAARTAREAEILRQVESELAESPGIIAPEVVEGVGERLAEGGGGVGRRENTQAMHGDAILDAERPERLGDCRRGLAGDAEQQVGFRFGTGGLSGVRLFCRLCPCLCFRHRSDLLACRLRQK